MTTKHTLTQAQIFTLFRLSNRVECVLRGDGLKANEHRKGINGLVVVNAPSIPVLFRTGYIDFSKQSDIREQNRYYGVKLADKGREFIAKATGESK